MATHGHIEAFDRGTDDWTNYCECLEQYFAAKDVEDEGKQRAILLSYCGAPTYRLICNLVVPANPTSKSFAELTKLVALHQQLCNIFSSTHGHRRRVNLSPSL